jgi:hypothetical protein
MTKRIPDYPEFDENQHVYTLATGGGDGWCATPPIQTAIMEDMQNATNSSDIDLEDWITFDLCVQLRSDPEPHVVARFDLTTWKWHSK